MIFGKLPPLFRRAANGVRRRPWLHALSLCTLFATFLSFAITLSFAQTVDRLLSRWIGGAELTVYVKEGVPDGDIDRLEAALAQTPGTSRVERISAARAREIFAREMGGLGDMVRSLPDAAFPVSLELYLSPIFAQNFMMRQALVDRIAGLAMVEEVDAYDDWFSKMAALSTAGRAAAWGLGISALIVAVLVISSVIRTGISARSREIEVLGLVGATERYIRFPFLLEGAAEAAIAMGLALLCAQLLLSKAESFLCSVMPVIGLSGIEGPSSKLISLLILGAAVAGWMGSRLSLNGALQRR